MANNITLLRICAVRDLCTGEEEYEEPEAPTIDMKDWPKSIEVINEFLGACLGVTNILLAYVIRHEEAIPVGEDPANEYPSVQDEMIARA